MKTIKHKSSSKKRQIIIVIFITVIAISILAFGMFWYNKYNTDIDNHKIIRSQNQNSDKTPTQQTGGLPNNTTTTTPSQVPTSTELSISITKVLQSNGIIQASAQTNGDGTCVFLFHPGDKGKPVTHQVETTSNVCSVDISQDEFSYLGQWSLNVTYYNGGNKTEASQDVTIN